MRRPSHRVLQPLRKPSSQWPVIEGTQYTAHQHGRGPRRSRNAAGPYRLGVTHVTGGGIGGPLPWKEADIRAAIERCKAAGLTLFNAMIGGFNKAIYGQPGRDEEIDGAPPVDPGPRQGGPPGNRIQLLCASCHGGLLRGTRKGRHWAHRLRLREDEGPPAAAAGGRPQPRRNVE